MNYDDPKLRSILAGEYVLGTMPARTRARFERLMRYDAGLVRLVGDWAERLGPIDETVITMASEPPPRVWTAIDARTRPRAVKETLRPRAPFVRRLAMWVVVAVCLAVIFNLFESMPTSRLTPQPHVVAVVTDADNRPCWLVTEDKDSKTLSVVAVWSPTIDPQHAFELWAIADNKPVAIGLAPVARDRVATFPAKSLPPNGVMLAVSVEPAGGSPTDSPTGPVLYHGAVLSD